MTYCERCERVFRIEAMVDIDNTPYCRDCAAAIMETEQNMAREQETSDEP